MFPADSNVDKKKWLMTVTHTTTRDGNNDSGDDYHFGKNWSFSFEDDAKMYSDSNSVSSSVDHFSPIQEWAESP